MKANDIFLVPGVIDELSTAQVLATEYVEGVPLDQCEQLDQVTRNEVSVVYCMQ